MKIHIQPKLNTGFQETHSLIFKCANGKVVSIDLFPDEFKELRDAITAYFEVNQ